MKTAQPTEHFKKICIVLPTYNERGNLQRIVTAIQRVLRSHGLADFASILIADDNSPDGTGELAEELTKTYGNVQVLHRPVRLGIGSVYRQGFAYAFQIEMLFRCQKEALKIAEVPIVFVGRRRGRTKLSKGEMLNFLLECMKLLFRRGIT